MVKIPSPRRLFRSRSKSTGGRADICAMVAEHEKIEWEVRPGGMLVQKWRAPEEDDDMAGAADVIQIRLGLPGWKSRFYKEKFGVETSNEVGNLRNVMVQKYLEGLCWVFQYYFAGVPSWSWYYPFYYAPFASDLKGLSRFNISFTVGKPLRPFDQLMTVLPPERSCALPKCYSKLMGCEESSIRKFYPSEVEIDTDGKRFFWQGIVKLPFIDEELLLSATKAVEKELAVKQLLAIYTNVTLTCPFDA